MKPDALETSTLLIYGGDGERQPGDNADDSQEQPDQNSEQSGDNTPDNQQDDSSDDGESDGGSSGPTLEDQLDAERKKNLAQAKELDKLKAAQRKAQGDRDAAVERDEYKGKYEALQEVLDSKFLVWSIQTDTKYDWNDADDVRKFIKDDEIKIDVETGEVQGLDLALKRIAKEKPYLLKAKEDEGDGRQPSGSHPFGGKITQLETDEKRLGAKYKIPGFGAQASRPV